MVERVVVGPWKTNCYIYSSTKKECIIIDPGGSDEEIASRVDVLNMVPVGIALTHGHVDHLAGLRALRDGYAARGYKLPIAISPADRKFLGIGAMENHRENLESLGLDEATFFNIGDEEELPKADVRLREGDRVFNMDLAVLETPGHTPGSVCFYSEREGILFSGDTLFFDNVGRSDLSGGSERKLRESIQKKIAVLPPETRVFPGHGPFTTVEREKRGNPYFRGMLQEARPVSAAPSLFALKPAPVQKPAAARVDGARPGATATHAAPRKAAATSATSRKAPRKPAAKPGRAPSARKASGGSRKTPAAKTVVRRLPARKPAAKKPAAKPRRPGPASRARARRR